MNTSCISTFNPIAAPVLQKANSLENGTGLKMEHFKKDCFPDGLVSILYCFMKSVIANSCICPVKKGRLDSLIAVLSCMHRYAHGREDNPILQKL